MEFEITSDCKISVENQTFDIAEETVRLMFFVLTVTHAIADSGLIKLLAELKNHEKC